MTITRKILLPLCIACFAVSSYAQETIRITNGEWLPYHSKELPSYGAGSKIVTEAFSLVGVKVEWGFFPWERGYKYAVQGEWDASIGWIKTLKREGEVLFSKPVYGGKWVFFHLRGINVDWNTVSDLKGVTIGATANYTYGEEFDTAEKEKVIYVERVPEEKQNFSKLLFGRIDIFAHAMDGGYAVLRNSFSGSQANKVTHHPKPIQTVNYHLVFTKNAKNKRMLKLFNKGLSDLYKSGKAKQYLKEAWDQHSK